MPKILTPRRNPRLAPLVALLLLFLAPGILFAGRIQNPPSTSPQQEDEPVKLKGELVDVVFSVMDANHRLIPNLKPEQIRLTDNGVDQAIDFFQETTNVPMVLALLIDQSGSQEFVLDDEKIAAETFFRNTFREGKDYAALMTFRGEADLIQGLTSNSTRLLDSLRRIRRERVFRTDAGLQSQGTSLYEAMYLAGQEILAGPTAKRITEAEGQNRYIVRRAIILLTDGKDTTSQRSIDEAIQVCVREGILVYAIGIGDNFRFGDVDTTSLDRICNETGGRASFPRTQSDLATAFGQIAKDLSSQYLIGYHPTDDEPGGKFHKIEISVSGASGYQVIHRSGYYAERK